MIKHKQIKKCTIVDVLKKTSIILLAHFIRPIIHSVTVGLVLGKRRVGLNTIEYEFTRTAKELSRK